MWPDVHSHFKLFTWQQCKVHQPACISRDVNLTKISIEHGFTDVKHSKTDPPRLAPTKQYLLPVATCPMNRQAPTT